MASPEWLNPGGTADNAPAGFSTSRQTPSGSPSLQPSPAKPEPAKSDLSKLIAEVAARYSGVAPTPEGSPVTPRPEAYAWKRGGPDFFPEGETSEAGESGDRADQLAREVEQLKRTLETQQQATRNAEKNAANLTEQLAATRAQVEKGLKQVHGGQRARIDRAESSVAQLKAEMHQTQRNLESERHARRAEVASAAAKVAEAERERSSAVAAQTAAQSRRPASFQVRLGLVAAASFAVVAAILLYWGFAPSVAGRTAAPVSSDVSSESATTDSPKSTALQRSLQSVASMKAAASKPVDKANEDDFTVSMDRLTKALSQFPGLAPEEVLRQISQTGNASDCAFNWNNGNPALIFTGGQISMAQALNRCAAAIEKFR